MTVTITLANLEVVVRSLVEDIDYDLAKQYNPDYPGREEPDGDTFRDLAERAWEQLVSLGTGQAPV